LNLPVPVLLVVFALQGWTESGVWKDSLLKNILENIPGVKVVVVDYLDGKGKLAQFKSHLTAEEYALRAEKVFRQVQKDYPTALILVLGHSLGGIVARILCLKGLFPSRNMILVGTPNHGITYKSIGGPVFGILMYLLFWALSSKHLCSVPVYRQLLRGNRFLLNILNVDGIPRDAYYIKGKRDPVVESLSSDPHNIGESVDCDHHLIPHNGRDVVDLSDKDRLALDNSAIPVIVRIVKNRLEHL